MIDQSAMGYAGLLALIALCSVLCGCSTSGSTGSIGASGLGFAHRTETLSGHKTAITVTPMTDVIDPRVSIDRDAQAYADRHAKQACPKGHEFFTDAPIAGRGNERIFVFQCK